MAFPVAQGVPSYSQTAIPNLWAQNLLAYFYPTAVTTQITNTDFAGEITKVGDKVTIRGLPEVTISDYVKGQDLVMEWPDVPTIDILIQRAKTWSFLINEVDLKQFDIPMVQRWSAHYASKLQLAIDSEYLAAAPLLASSLNIGATAGAKSASYNLGVAGTPLQLTPTNVIQVLTYCQTVLDEQNVPMTERSLVLPMWAKNILLQSNLQQAYLTGDSKSILRTNNPTSDFNICGFQILFSNQLAYTTADKAWLCPFQQKRASCFVTQLIKNKIETNPKGFETYYMALQVYDWKVVKPEAMGYVYIKM